MGERIADCERREVTSVLFQCSSAVRSSVPPAASVLNSPTMSMPVVSVSMALVKNCAWATPNGARIARIGQLVLVAVHGRPSVPTVSGAMLLEKMMRSSISMRNTSTVKLNFSFGRQLKPRVALVILCLQRIDRTRG